MQTVTTTASPPLLTEHIPSFVEKLSRRLAASDRTLPIASGAVGILVGSAIGRVLRPTKHKHRKLFKARFASAGVARSLAAFALGASATGAMAIGALAIGKLKIKDLDIEKLRVGSVVEGSHPLRPASV